MKVNNTNIELKAEYSIEQDVDLVFNSASGLLFMRTGTAKAIREYSESLNTSDRHKYDDYIQQLNHPIVEKYLETFRVSEWEPTQAQLSSFEKIISNNGPFKTGDIILDKNWSKKYKKDILHVVGMTYYLDNGELNVDKVTQQSLTHVLTKAIGEANIKKYTTISIPVLCTRGDYGLHPKASLESILDAIKNSETSNIHKIIICFESEGPQEFLKTLDTQQYQ